MQFAVVSATACYVYNEAFGLENLSSGQMKVNALHLCLEALGSLSSAETSRKKESENLKHRSDVRAVLLSRRSPWNEPV